MNKVRQVPATYDDVYQTGGFANIFNLPYWRSPYYPLFKAARKEVGAHRVSSLLEVGCGSGAFAHMMLSRTNVHYRGFDFSPVAVQKAVQRCGADEHFFVADATNPSSYTGKYDALVCMEVLEHVPDDLQVIANWPTGKTVICSVPNFDSRYHERFFLTPQDIEDRYGNLLCIQAVRSVWMPVLSDLALANVAKAALGSIGNPRKLAAVLGVSRLFTSRRWFLFSAVRC